MPAYGTIDHEYGITLATTPPEQDGPVWMVNLMRYKEHAEYTDGRETSLTGREADDAYTPLGPLAAVGAELVYVADVEDHHIGDDARWDRVAVVKYPTRRAFIEMQERADFQEAHEHKEAGMAETIVIGAIPFATERTSQLKPDWNDVPHPPTDDDGPYTMLHIIRFHEEDGAAITPELMETYQHNTVPVAVPNGVRIDGWFSAEGTIIGDGRSWHQVRLNAFPSRRALMAIAADPDRQASQREHRETAIVDTYALGLRPRLNRLAESVQEST